MKLSEEIIQAIRSYRENHTLKECAYKFNVSYSCVWKYCEPKPIWHKNKDVKDYFALHILDEIVEHYGITRRQAYMISYNDDYSYIKQKEKSAKVKEILADYQNGLKQIAIARKYNVSRQYVNQLVHG